MAAMIESASPRESALWSPHRHLLESIGPTYLQALEITWARDLLGGGALAAMEAAERARIVGSPIESLFPSYTELVECAARIETPWFRPDAPEESLASLGTVTALSAALRLEPYQTATTVPLRALLGDWTAAGDAALAAYEAALGRLSPLEDDTNLRLELYSRLGFDARLTAIPDVAFGDILYKTSLLRDELFVPGFSDPEPEDDEEEQRFVVRSRREAAYSIVTRVEEALRQFLADTLEGSFGSTWMKRQVGSELLKTWREKQRVDIAAGKPEEPLIAYAGFPDYREIILRRDNWNTCFKSRFARQEDIGESLRRLNTVRLPIVHTRTVTKEDFILLVSEATRVLRAIGEDFDPDDYLE